MEAHTGAPWTEGLDLYNPRDAAIAAWNVSRQGADIGPWTVTHTDRGSRYMDFAEEARAAAAAYGEPANGNFTGPANYSSPDVPAGAAGAIPFAHAAPTLPPPVVAEPMPTGEGSVERFLEAALAQQGDRYVFDAQTRADDPDPEEFDCSELVEWAAAQVGVQVSEASFLQYNEMKAAGTLISVEEAINTPGALLFKFPSEPTPGQSTRLEGSHVAISLGDGRTIEAMSPKLGVRISEAGDRFGYAALIPGMDYTNPPATIDTSPLPAPAPLPPPEPSPLDIAAWNSNSVDTDQDMLPDHFEIKYLLDPNQPDTDGDGITDGYELVVLGSKADRLDTDFDQLTDGLELVLGLDPLVADNPDPDVALAIPDELHIDTDGDGLTDWGEETAGTDAADPDSDDDLVLDGDELFAGTDPLTADS
jgi:cell wall-associated NlpC family hydrolase